MFSVIFFIYLSDGTKLSALDGSGAGLVYRGPFVYRKSSGGNAGSSLTLESAAFGGGLMTPSGAMFYVTDYLGSVRAVVDGKTGDLYKASDYSAFGDESVVMVRPQVDTPPHPLATAVLPDGQTLRDGYTGKEAQNEDFGTSYIDFGARQYSPALRRWMTPDPLSEKYYGTSPYAFCNNNPLRYVDVNGMDWRDKVAGYSIGFVTNLIPGTGFIRDWYSPDNSSDYNSALKHTDEAAAALGIGMIGAGTGTMAAGGILATAGVGVTASTAGVGIVIGGPAVAAGAEMAAGGAATASIGGVMVMNSSKNKSDGYERGKSNSNTHKTNKSGNQLQKAIEKGKAPKSIDRYDNGKGDYEKPHVHFKDGNALNQDGTWKHGGRDLTNKEKEFLKRYDWKTE